MFVGLILAQALYAYRFLLDMIALFPMVGDKHSEKLLLGVLGLVDMLMVANLIAMIVIGGYTLFVSKLNIGHNEDKPEWLDTTTAATSRCALKLTVVLA